VNSLLNGSKEGKTSLNLLSMLTAEPLSFNHCLGVRLFSDMLQLKDLRVGQWEELCIEFTQENSVQDGLPYIQIPNGLCELFLTYPK